MGADALEGGLGREIGRGFGKQSGEAGPAEGFDAFAEEVPSCFEVEPLAFQAEGHVGQIEHGWVFAAVVGAEIVVGGGVMGVRIHGERVTW